MRNYIIKTLVYSKQARILFLDNTDMVREICNGRNMDRLLKEVLERTVSIAALISGTLKGTQRVSLKVIASGGKYKVFADADSYGNVRGYINDELLNVPSELIEKLTIEQLMGTKGCIQVLKDLGMNSIFTGITDMPYGNIVDDFSYYFKQSEQTSSLFSITIVYNENNEIVLSRGIMAQLLPGAADNLLDVIEGVIANKQDILSTLEKHQVFNELPYAMFEDIEIVGIDETKFYCGCSKEMFYPMINSLSREELEDTINKGQPIEIICNVCGKKYSFNLQELSL